MILEGEVLLPPVPMVGPLIYGFALLLALFLLINADRRFREYISRALVRPFNFFADVRDRRLIPGGQTTILAVILAGSLGLCFAPVFRLLFEVPEAQRAITNMFSSTMRENFITYLSNYFPLLVLLTALAFLAIVFLTGVLRFIAIFVKGRILFGDTFNVAVWSLLPVAFLLPFDLILPRMDADMTTVLLAMWTLVIVFLWFFYRFLKGAGVLFDVYPTRIYIYGTITLGVISLLVYLYLHSYNVL